MYCLDANIWVYYFDSELDDHERIAHHIDTILGREPLFLPAVVAMEVVHYLSNQIVRSEPLVETFLHLDGTTTAPLTVADVRRASALLETHGNTGIGGRDAAILATMQRHAVSTLWTHDGALVAVAESLDWLDVVDPVVDDVA